VPPRRPDPKSLATSLGITVTALADRTMINGKAISRRTIYKLFDQGAPFTSEEALRQWLGNNGARVGAVVPSLTDVVNQTLTASAQSAPSAPAGPQTYAPACNADGSVLSPKQQADLAAVRARDSTTYVNQLDIMQRQRVLLHRDAVASAIGGLGTDVISQLSDLPSRLMRRLGDACPAELRPTLRTALAAEILTIRATLVAKVPERLTELLNGDTP
jgi:hypothetical protein